MYHTVAEFQADYRFESEATLKVLRNLTDEALPQRVHPDVRAVNRLAWHLVVSVAQMAHEAGLKGVAGSKDDEAIPATAAEIVDAYASVSKSLIDTVGTAWTDAQLPEEIPMYGESWSRGLTLSVLLRHEIHHRAQLTVLMRQVGLPVPGCYGPAREEWAAMGMTAMA